MASQKNCKPDSKTVNMYQAIIPAIALTLTVLTAFPAFAERSSGRLEQWNPPTDIGAPRTGTDATGTR